MKKFDSNSSVDTDMKVKDIMSNSIISLKPSDTLAEASKVMKGNKISCLPIMNENKSDIVGIITTTDLMNIYTSADKELHMDPWSQVSEFMSSPVVTIGPDAEVKEASKLMKDKHFHHLIVVDKNKKILGVISSLDIAKSIE